MIEDEIQIEEGDHSVPEDLLGLHIDLEEAEVSPSDFKEAFGNETSDQGTVES